jgi:hypothetical protein
MSKKLQCKNNNAGLLGGYQPETGFHPPMSPHPGLVRTRLALAVANSIPIWHSQLASTALGGNTDEKRPNPAPFADSRRAFAPFYEREPDKFNKFSPDSLIFSVPAPL